MKINDISASASQVYNSGDIIHKVVNASTQPFEIQINLNRAESLKGQGTATVFTSSSPLDENTLGEPTKIFTKIEIIKFSSSIITHTFPGNSLTFLCSPTKKKIHRILVN